VVDTLGLIWALVITPASVQDAEGAKEALTQFRRQVKFPKVIWVDAAYRAVVSWAWVCWVWTLEVVCRPKGQKTFVVQPKRWIVERTFGWLGRYRRLCRDFEHTTVSSEAMVYLASIRRTLRMVTTEKVN